MYMFHGKDELSCYEACKILLEVLVHVQLLRQISMVAQLHHHVEIVWCLKGVHELEDVSMIESFHYLGFRDGVSDLIVVNQLLL